jgi:hypothetical protein
MYETERARFRESRLKRAEDNKNKPLSTQATDRKPCRFRKLYRDLSAHALIFSAGQWLDEPFDLPLRQ